MKIGILQCDKVKDKFIAEHGHYPDMFASLLHAVDPAIEFILFDAEQGEFPEDIDAADAYLITGSRHGVNDGYAWIAQLEDFVRTLYAARKKVVGICFGHQLIAKALGGQVIKSPKGWGIGVSRNKVLAQKQWMGVSPEHFNLLVSHQDQVVTIPEGAEILAGSDFCPNYMMQIGTHFSIQGHPEFTKAYSRALILSREDILDKTQFDQGLRSLELTEDSHLIAQWIVNFIKAT